MEVNNIYAGQRVLYKVNDSSWRVGNLITNGAFLGEDGLRFMVQDPDGEKTDMGIPVSNLFFEAEKLQDWEKDSSNGIIYTKQEFIDYINDEEFDARLGEAFVSDGEYKYYRVAHFNEGWINRQPFEYILWYT